MRQDVVVLGEIVAFVSEQVHGLTLARVGHDIAAAWDEFSVTNGIEGNVASVDRYVSAFLRDVCSVISSILPTLSPIMGANGGESGSVAVRAPIL